jgi:hypothetical protein
MKRLTIEEAKSNISIVAYLAKQDHFPVGMSGKRHRFKSVFRAEKEPSMFVDDKIGLWNDFGHGGGTIIDLAMQMHGFSNIPETLVHLTEISNSLISTSNQTFTNEIYISDATESAIKNVRIQPLNHFVLLKYLREERGISEQIAKRYLKLVWYDNKNRTDLFSIGWKNDSGNFELRSAGKNDFKAVTGKKDISTIVNNTKIKTAFVFESMLDFLSALMMKKQSYLEGTVYILNSTSLVKKLIPLLVQNNFELIHVFFDNDDAGENAKAMLLAFCPNPSVLKIQTFYAEFNDVNEYWVSLLKQ